MRSFSLVSIVLLCIGILVIDVLAFHWLQSITQLLGSESLRWSINILFWTFTVGLLTAIILLKLRLDHIHPSRKHLWISSFYGLTVSSFLPKLIFVVIISVLYFSNYLFSETQSMVVVPLVGLLSGFLPFFVIGYGIFKAAYHFKVYHHRLKFQTLPTAFDGLRIVQISDIHVGSLNHRYHVIQRAVQKINHLHPDYIFITGDLINNYGWELEGWESTFRALKANRAKIAILGNHDYGDYSHWDSLDEKAANLETLKNFYTKIDFTLLLNNAWVDREHHATLAVVGVENWGKPPFKQYGDLQEALREVEQIPFKILLSHDPSHWEAEVLEKTDIALTLSGHTHGMQAGFQLGNLQWSPIKFKYKHWAGLYEKLGQYLYVNRGLGWLGFPGRIGMRPEITLLELLSVD